MRKRMGLATRRELVQAISARYTTSTQLDRVKILDEFVAATGYHRKPAIRVLAGKATTPAVREPRLRLYDAAVREALIVLWEASDRVCGKRLKPHIPILLDAMARHGHLHPEGEVRERLLAVSAATIDRLLAPTRSAVRGRVRRAATPSVRRAVPVRTFNDWKDPPPGFTEADLVAHCGGSLSGSFVHTLTVTDIASGWTECGALAVREGSLVVAGVTRLRGMLPFQMLGLDTDNGSEFLNETMLAYCREQSIEFTRSRPCRKGRDARPNAAARRDPGGAAAPRQTLGRRGVACRPHQCGGARRIPRRSRHRMARRRGPPHSSPATDVEAPAALARAHRPVRACLGTSLRMARRGT